MFFVVVALRNEMNSGVFGLKFGRTMRKANNGNDHRMIKLRYLMTKR